MHTFENVFLQILNIIKYSGDKQNTIKEFVMIIQLEALFFMIDRLDSEKRDLLKKTLQTTSHYDQEVVKKLIEENFSTVERDEAVSIVSKRILIDYFESIASTISDEQIKQIHNVLKINNNSPINL